MLPSKASPVSAPRSGAPERYRTTWAPRRSANASPCLPTRPTTHCWFWAALGPEYWDELTASRKGSEATSPTQVGELLTAGRHPCWTCRTAMSGGVPTSSSRVPTTDHRRPTTDHRPPTTDHDEHNAVFAAYIRWRNAERGRRPGSRLCHRSGSEPHGRPGAACRASRQPLAVRCRSERDQVASPDVNTGPALRHTRIGQPVEG